MSNPFSNYEENPFADAAVLEASEFGEEPQEEKKSGKKGKKGGEGERLFTGPSSSSSSSPPREDDDRMRFTSSPSPPPAAAAAFPPPAYYQDEELRRKEEELRRKERELAERQRQLEQQARLSGGSKPPNWPPCRPWIYHSIPDEIPLEHQRTVRLLYHSWLISDAIIFLNMIGCLCILIAGVRPEDFGSSILYLILIPPLSFFLWYRPVYNALMKDNGFYFLMYLLFGGFHVLFEAYLALGIPKTGGSGFINGIYLFSKQEGAAVGEGVVVLLVAILWVGIVLLHAYLYMIVYKQFRTRGHTLQSVRNQTIADAARSEAGRQVITTAVAGAAEGMTAPQRV